MPNNLKLHFGLNKQTLQLSPSTYLAILLYFLSSSTPPPPTHFFFSTSHPLFLCLSAAHLLFVVLFFLSLTFCFSSLGSVYWFKKGQQLGSFLDKLRGVSWPRSNFSYSNNPIFCLGVNWQLVVVWVLVVWFFGLQWW